jgi:hypothetical protein
VSRADKAQTIAELRRSMIAMCDGSRKLPVASSHSIMLYLIAFFLLLVSTGLEVRGQCPEVCRCPSSHVANCASVALNKIPNER